MNACASVAIKNVLFPTDFSAESMQALQELRCLQRHFDARVYILHVLDLLPYSLSSDSSALAKRQEMRESGLAEMEKFVRSNHLDAPKFESAVVSADVSSGVEDFARQHDIDLIVLGSRAETGIRRLFAGSMAEEIFREARCAVMVIGPRASLPARAGTFQHLLLASDLSETSKAAIPFVEFFLSQDRQTKISLAHCLEHDPGTAYERHATREKAAQALKNLLSPLFRQRIGEVVVEFCSVKDGVIDIARGLSADLLFLGVRQGGAFTRAETHGLRSITYRVIAESPCPVLTVRRGQQVET